MSIKVKSQKIQSVGKLEIRYAPLPPEKLEAYRQSMRILMEVVQRCIQKQQQEAGSEVEEKQPAIDEQNGL